MSVESNARVPTQASPAKRLAPSSRQACSVCHTRLMPAAQGIATGTNMSDDSVFVKTRAFHKVQNSAFPQPMVVTKAASRKEETTAAATAAQHTTVTLRTVSRRVVSPVSKRTSPAPTKASDMLLTYQHSTI